jgi:ABC-type transporter Mla MlaB component
MVLRADTGHRARDTKGGEPQMTAEPQSATIPATVPGSAPGAAPVATPSAAPAAAPASPARVVLHVECDLKRDGLRRVRELLEDVLYLAPPQVVLDLTGCADVDAAGVRMLVTFRRRLAARGAVLEVLGGPSALQRLVAVRGVEPRHARSVDVTAAGPSMPALAR